MGNSSIVKILSIVMCVAMVVGTIVVALPQVSPQYSAAGANNSDVKVNDKKADEEISYKYTVKVVDKDNNEIISKESTNEKSLDVIKSTSNIFDENNISYRVTQGMFEDINGASNDDYQWVMYLNGVKSDVRASAVSVGDGDSIEWKMEKIEPENTQNDTEENIDAE